MKKIHKSIGIVLFVMLFAAVLSACGGGKDSAPGTQAETTAAETTAAQTTAAQATAPAAAETSQAEPASTAAESAAAGNAGTAGFSTEQMTLPGSDFKSGKEDDAEDEAGAEKAEQIENSLIGAGKTFSQEGVYTAFAAENEGLLGSMEEMGLSSILTLEEGGKGSMTLDDDSMGITNWSVSGTDFEITLDDGGKAKGTLHDGIVEIDLYGDGSMIICYAQEGADISAYEFLPLEEIRKILKEREKEQTAAISESKLYKLWETIDPSKGVHLKYSRYNNYYDTAQGYDVHIRDGVYYSRCETVASGKIKVMITFIDKDRKVYNLYPDEMRGTYVTEYPEFMGADGVMMMDDLLADISHRVTVSDYSEETMELDGGIFEAEIFDAESSYPMGIFLFGKDGRLETCVMDKDPEKEEADIEDAVYTIDAIDDKVDESLLDISGYQIN